jgi:hypothetical protein
MPETIKTAHTLFTLIAAGVLFGLGFSLARLVVGWPAGRVAAGAAIACVLVVLLAWLIP